MQDTATIIAHILFRSGAILNISKVLRNLDTCLGPYSDGAYSLIWDSEDTMVATFAQTKMIIVAGHQQQGQDGFALTLAISPADDDAVANPKLPVLHNAILSNLVKVFEQPHWTNGVLWQRAPAPVTVEMVENISEILASRLTLLSSLDKHAQTSADLAELLPLDGRPLKVAARLPI